MHWTVLKAAVFPARVSVGNMTFFNEREGGHEARR